MKSALISLLPAICLITITAIETQAQEYWQQKAEYKMAIDMDVENHQFKGHQNLTYHNNSPDTLHRVYYHLYFNAFQPGSMMDVRSRTIDDPDQRIGERIAKLKPHEQGYHKIQSLQQDGQNLDFEVDGTILKVKLDEPILPGEKTVFEMDFKSQVPVQIRRSGRDNKEGVDYSMAQWYPKMAEYDRHGWHADPYVQREFQGVWGSFDVKITIDSSYVLGGTGYLQNPGEIGHGYQDSGQSVDRPNGDQLTWHFRAPRVHDFMWAADPDFKHDTRKMDNGPDLHFLYQPYEPDTIIDVWKKFQPKIAEAFRFMSNHFGKYPYKQYSVIQGGDGGMEYPMSTLITGDRNMGSLVGVTCHELAHNWYQGVLASNENMYAWMDEGMTVYTSTLAMNKIMDQDKSNPLAGSYRHYRSAVEQGYEEPMNTHADFFTTNKAYSLAAYSKGAIFLHQLSYIVGQETFDKAFKAYFHEWKFKHPYPKDFKRVMEKTSGFHLGWYFNLWLTSTRTIDYGIHEVRSQSDSATIRLKNYGTIPMPIDFKVIYESGKTESFHIPLNMTYAIKNSAQKNDVTVLEDWPWPYPEYQFQLPVKKQRIKAIEIDPSGRMADVKPENNQWPKPETIQYKGRSLQKQFDF